MSGCPCRDQLTLRIGLFSYWIHLFYWHYHTALITVASWCILKSGFTVPSLSSFLSLFGLFGFFIVLKNLRIHFAKHCDQDLFCSFKTLFCECPLISQFTGFSTLPAWGREGQRPTLILQQWRLCELLSNLEQLPPLTKAPPLNVPGPSSSALFLNSKTTALISVF